MEIRMLRDRSNEKSQILGYKDVTDNEFWIRGHIPGRPLMPGVIMIEAAAQLCSFFLKEIFNQHLMLM